MMRSKTLATALLGLALASRAPRAHASVTFPEALRKELGLAVAPGPPPGCQLCHKDDVGGPKTAIKPFGRSVLQAGATGGNVPSLLAALGTLESDGSDSDRDGVGDIAELRAGRDPNVVDVTTGEGGAESALPSPLPEIPLPETGCSLVGAAPTGAWLTLAGFASLAWLRRRRSR